MTSEEIFHRLAGRWKLDRIIFGQGRLSGEVVFISESPTRLRCEETGNLTLATGEKITASRSYIYELKGDHINIFYNDLHRKNEILHELFFTDGPARHCHQCGNDKYDLTFVFSNEGRIEMKYDIHGPKKNYRIESVLRPI